MFYFALVRIGLLLFRLPVVRIKRLADMGGLTGVHSMFLDWKWTREDSRWLSQVGPACVVSAKGLSVSLFGYSTAWLPVSHCSLGGVTDFRGRVSVLTRVSSGPLTIQPASLPTGSSRDLRSVLKFPFQFVPGSPQVPGVRIAFGRFGSQFRKLLGVRDSSRLSWIPC